MRETVEKVIINARIVVNVGMESIIPGSGNIIKEDTMTRMKIEIEISTADHIILNVTWGSMEQVHPQHVHPNCKIHLSFQTFH